MPLVICPVCASDEIDVVENLADGRRKLRCERGHEWIIGMARPDPAAGAELSVFQTDDAPYFAWIDTWPGGYVLNCEGTRNPNDLVLHRAWCASISRLQPDKTTFVEGEFIKVCCTDRHKVREWAREHCGENPAGCQLCM